MHLNERDREEMIHLSSGWEVQAVFEGRHRDRGGGMDWKGHQREAGYRLQDHQELVVGGLRLWTAWEFWGQQGDVGEHAT